MASVVEIEEKLEMLENQIKDLIELTIEVRRETPANKKITAEIIEKRLVRISKHIKERSKETGESLSAGINIWKFL